MTQLSVSFLDLRQASSLSAQGQAETIVIYLFRVHSVIVSEQRKEERQKR